MPRQNQKAQKTELEICLALKYLKKYYKLFGYIENILYLYRTIKNNKHETN